ncbi:MAG: choice-of-anchor B family protein [Streptosporangiales bacterium]|nr:choice-of-anchor B family protein [Streptosporangiales bacterium]
MISLGAAPSVAHDDPLAPSMAQQAEEFEEVASKPSPKSGAPKTSAPCVRGMAADTYPCHRIDMLSHLSLDDLGVSFVNDMWGWTDPLTRKDYALVGATEGTVIVDVSHPTRPDVVGTLPAHALDPEAPFWRDLKVYANHMFVVSEQQGHGLQVFDLTEVRGVKGEPVTFGETAHYDGFATSHNVNVNTRTGFLYAVGTHNADGSDSCAGGLHMVDVRDPADPTFAGCFSEHEYIHDTQCVTYRGPDKEHRDREICFNANAVSGEGDDYENFLSIVDVTDKSNPIPLARADYPNDGYSHQGWLTPSQRYFLHGDELDEVNHGIGTTTRVWDVRDLDNPTLIEAFENDTTSIDHNIYPEGRVAFASNYTSGLRVYDTRKIGRRGLSEVAYFDVYPENDNPSFEGGTWSNYPYFRQRKVVAVSSMDRGLFVLSPRGGR